jgi:hypothetical protein
VNELSLTDRAPIEADSLSDEQKRNVDLLCRESSDLRAAFNKLLREKGFELELVQFQLSVPRPTPAQAVGDPPPIIVPDIPSHPPPGGCYCCKNGVCYCC